MRPLNLILRNFIGIRSGLGRDELAIDLKTVTEDAELVAIIGPNGTGKTTVLDNLHPFLLMPSRAGSYSPGSFSFYDHTFGEAGKELVWEHAGRTYRSSLVFKQTAKTRKTEAYLSEQYGDGWRPVTLPDNTSSDGKVETYNRCLEHILGSPEMFFTAAFSSQGRRNLSSYTNGDIKGLLSELLGLEHIRGLGKKAADVVKGLSFRIDAMRDDLTKISEHETALAAAANELQSATEALKIQEEAKKRARLAVGEASRKLADVQADATSNTEIEIRRQDLSSRLSAAKSRLTAAEQNAERDIAVESQRKQSAQDAAQREQQNLQAQTTKDLDQEDAKLQRTQQSIGNDIKGLEQQTTAANAQIERNTALLNRRDELEQAKNKATDLAEKEKSAASALESAKATDQRRLELKAQADRISDALGSIKREGERLAGQCMALKARSALTEEVPCKGTDLQGRCKLLAEAMEAKNGIPAAEKDTDNKRTEYAQERDKLAGLRKQLEEIGDTAAALKKCEGELESIRKAIRENNSILALEPAIASAHESIEAAKRQVLAAQESITAKRAALKEALESSEQAKREIRAREDVAMKESKDRAAAVEKEASERILSISGRLKQAETEINAEIAKLQQELSLLPPPADTSPLEQAQQALEAAERSLSEAEQAATASNTRIGMLNERISTLKKALTNAGWLKAIAAKLTDEIAHWTALSKAFGNDGIVALTIDDAGPTLASLANDLLLSCYGPRFSVAIRTQEENAKGDMKETFDIMVFDSERGDEKSVRDMSGGEKIYINEALTRAMALYQAQASGQRYECLFADESDGALDAEKKRHYVTAMRRVMQLGGYKQCFWISHTPELWDMADATINMEGFRSA